MIPKKLNTPDTPRFLMAADAETEELYIVCAAPLALLWVRQTTPAQLYIIKGEQDEDMLRDAAEWYRKNAAGFLNNN